VTDRDLQDSTLLDEIEMYGELVIAASASEGPLPANQIDLILGVGPPSRSHERAGSTPGGTRDHPSA